MYRNGFKSLPWHMIFTRERIEAALTGLLGRPITIEAALSEARAFFNDYNVTPAEIVAEDRHGDVRFYVEDAGMSVSCYEIGWGHGGGPPAPGKYSQYTSMQQYSAQGWGLYHDNCLHDGFISLEEVMSSLGDEVYLSLEDYRAGRSVPITSVIDAARAWAKLPPLSETPEAEITNEIEDDE